VTNERAKRAGMPRNRRLGPSQDNGCPQQKALASQLPVVGIKAVLASAKPPFQVQLPTVGAIASFLIVRLVEKPQGG
jgi:hypothetical protein